jgi:hypothetical protein
MAGILVILGLAVLTVHAEEFWVKKEWRNWSKDDCKKMLQDSPWTRKWAESQVNLGSALPSLSGAGRDGAAGDTSLEVHYYVQDRSSIPVREAFIRQMQLENNYDKMDEAHKKGFDAQAETFLNRAYDDVILIHVEYGSNVTPFERQLANHWKSMRENAIPLNVFLINERDDHIPPIRFVSPKNGDYSFELFFPRMRGGEQIIRDTDKMFTVEFRTPAVGSQNAGNTNNPKDPKVTPLGRERVLSEFKVDRMMWNGKPSF